MLALDDGRALDLSRMLCGGMARTLEFVSRVLPESMVGLVDCIEWMSEKVDDFAEEEQNETKEIGRAHV